MYDLSFETARGAMHLVRSMKVEQIVQAIGITEADIELTTGDEVWTIQDRQQVRRTLDAFAAGVMDLTGVPRFEMPAEFIAAVIATFVSPTNIMVACRWMEGQRPAEILVGATSTAHVVDPAELFVICCRLRDTEGAAGVRENFRKKVHKSLKSAAKLEETNGQTSAHSSHAQA